MNLTLKSACSLGLRPSAGEKRLYSYVEFYQKGYLHSTLLTCLQALEVFHRESYPDETRFDDPALRKKTIKALRDAIPEDVGPAVQKADIRFLAFVGDITLVERLNRLRVLYPTTLNPLFPAGSSDMSLLRMCGTFSRTTGGRKFDKKFFTSRRRASPPKPPVSGASWMTTARPVLLTEARIVASSRGFSVAISMTSADIPSPSAIPIQS